MDTFSVVLQVLKAELNNLAGHQKLHAYIISLLLLSPVNTEVWSNTQEAVTAEPSALKSGLQQICMFLTASEFF